jgi:surface protein
MKNLIYLFLTVLIVACTTDDNNNVDNSNTLEKEWLYTHTALEATATSSTTIVIPFTADIFAFTDRPNREYKYISGDEFASYWNDYDDENSFKLDPPNAVLTWVDADGVSEVEVVITDADFDGTNVIYTIENTTITANQTFEDVSLFVDGNGSNNNVYLAFNGFTVKASARAVVGDTGVINGVTYTVVDEAMLRTMVDNGGDVDKVATTKVTDMSFMFENSTSLIQPIGRWDVSNVTKMRQMFYDATFNQLIGAWDVSSVTDMDFMFYGATFNQPISSWDVSSVTDMSNMFNGSAFNQPIGNWDVSSVTDMGDMFSRTVAFNQPIGDWDVSNVTDMDFMFSNATYFNQPIGNWDVSNVTDMRDMFYYALSYNQDLSSWSVDNVTECNSFSDGVPYWTLPQPNFTNCFP